MGRVRNKNEGTWYKIILLASHPSRFCILRTKATKEQKCKMMCTEVMGPPLCVMCTAHSAPISHKKVPESEYSVCTNNKKAEKAWGTFQFKMEYAYTYHAHDKFFYCVSHLWFPLKFGTRKFYPKCTFLISLYLVHYELFTDTK